MQTHGRGRVWHAALAFLPAGLGAVGLAEGSVQFLSQTRSVSAFASAPGGRSNSDNASAPDFTRFMRTASASISANVSEPPGSSGGSGSQNTTIGPTSLGGMVSASASRQPGTFYSASGGSSFSVVFTLDAPTPITITHSRAVGGTRFALNASLTGPGGSIFQWMQAQFPPANTWGDSPLVMELQPGQYSLAFGSSASAGPGDNLDVSSSGMATMNVSFVPAPGVATAMLVLLGTARRSTRVLPV